MEVSVTPPAFNWKPLEAMPREGKFLILNLNRRHMETSISTATLNKTMPAQLIADYLRDSLCWDYYPNVEIARDEPNPDPQPERAIA